MTELNFKELLQVEIDKVQGYVDGKKEAITNAEFNLTKDKNQLADLEVKLKELLDKKQEFLEFEAYKATKEVSKSNKEASTSAKEFAGEAINSIKKSSKSQDTKE